MLKLRLLERRAIFTSAASASPASQARWHIFSARLRWRQSFFELAQADSPRPHTKTWWFWADNAAAWCMRSPVLHNKEPRPMDSGSLGTVDGLMFGQLSDP
jgi:hypothetical protein